MLKRKRPGSPKVKLASIQYAKSIRKRRQPAAYRIVYLVSGTVDVKLFYMEIPSSSLYAFRKGEYKDDVDEKTQQLPTTPQLLATTTWCVFGKPAVIGSTIYTMGTKYVTLATHKVLEIFTLDLISEFKEWEPLLSPPPSDIEVTDDSVLASIRGCLYVLGAYPCFGAVFDPKTQIWSKLEIEVDLSKGVYLRSVDVTFIASLGDKVGKILVHDLDKSSFYYHSFIRLYDVDSNQCLTCDGLPLARVKTLDIFDSPIPVSEDGQKFMLYFITTRGFIYAFDWKAMTLFKGRVSGFWEAGLNCLPFSATSFLHFGHDLFCLCFSTPYVYPAGGRCTCLHYVFIRVIKLDASLDAYVVGRFKDLIEGRYHPCGAFFV